jgi:hypothetical protein
MTYYLAGIVISLAAVSTASAQDVRASRPGDLAVVLEPGPGVGGVCGTGAGGRTMCVSPSNGYAPSSIAENTRTRFDEEALESAIIAAAMGDAIPNPGDQFPSGSTSPATAIPSRAPSASALMQPITSD